MRACKGDETQVYCRQPRRVMHTRRILWLRGRETVGKKEEEAEERKKQRRTGRGCCVGAQRAIFTRGVGFCEFQPRNVIAPAGIPWFIGLLPISAQEELGERVVYGLSRPRSSPSRSRKMAEMNIASYAFSMNTKLDLKNFAWKFTNILNARQFKIYDVDYILYKI